jgi:hypothetical protein
LKVVGGLKVVEGGASKAPGPGSAVGCAYVGLSDFPALLQLGMCLWVVRS